MKKSKGRKLLNVKEVSEMTNENPSTFRQWIKPDDYKMVETSNRPIALYYESSILAYMAKKKKKAEDKIAKRLKKLSGMKRPEPIDEWFLREEAVMKYPILDKCLTVFAKGVSRKFSATQFVKFYHIDELKKAIEMKTKFDNGELDSKIRVGRGKKSRCDQCGKMFNSFNLAVTCNKCLTGVDKDDPYGVMIPPKKQGRRCPECGGELWEEEYMCRSCTKEREAEMNSFIDPDYAYGSISHTGV